MMSSKFKMKQLILAVSVSILASSPVAMAQDTKIMDLKEGLSNSTSSGYVSDVEFKKAMESIAKQQALMERKAQLRKFEVESGEAEEKSEKEEEVEPTLEQKLNPPKDAKEVSIEFFDLMEKEYQKNLYDLRQEIKNLKEQIKDLKDPKNKEVIEDHLYVTEIYSVGNNKYATMMWDFHFFEDTTEGEEVIPGVKVVSIVDKGVKIQKKDGTQHFIYKVSKRRALENAWAAKKQSEALNNGPTDNIQRPQDIDIRPPMGGQPMGMPVNGGGMPGELPIFPQ